MTKTRTALAAAAIILPSILAGAAVGAASTTVDQAGLAFNMPALTVKRGQSVVFQNSDRTVHNITVSGPGMTFNGGLQKPGDKVSVLFTKAGAFNVSCGIHPKMKMTVTAS
ncbi:cupredoxin domain-containing protein [Phenylobacterium sp.]|jgi:cytochrome c peroxidase|uniref:cupredoxin domain-containing protein n=1 Tax=Phenylobacterium sp. TaxID=1871053 RepID=UPI002F9572B3